ncbi:MAG: hypothetical protein PUD60_08335 [Akkermansia muciniphila]|nr:hypothetical protein [Akkermansia muciniphila]
MKQVPMYNLPALRSSRLLPVVLRTGCCSLALSAAMLLAVPQVEAGVAGTARKVAVKVIKGAPKTGGGMVDDAAEVVAGKLGRSLSVAEKEGLNRYGKQFGDLLTKDKEVPALLEAHGEDVIKPLLVNKTATKEILARGGEKHLPEMQRMSRKELSELAIKTKKKGSVLPSCTDLAKGGAVVAGTVALAESVSAAEKVSDGLAEATKKMDPTPVFRDISRPLGIGITLVFGLVVIYLCGLVYKLVRTLLKPLRPRKQALPDSPPAPQPNPTEPDAATDTPTRCPIAREELLRAEADNSARPSGVKQVATPLPCGSSGESSRKLNPEELVTPEV